MGARGRGGASLAPARERQSRRAEPQPVGGPDRPHRRRRAEGGVAGGGSRRPHNRGNPGGITVNITTIGRARIGGGLGNAGALSAGHAVRLLGRDGGDVSAADVVLIAVPSGAISEALGRVDGSRGQAIAIDAIECLRRARRAATESLGLTRSRHGRTARSRRRSTRTAPRSSTASPTRVSGPALPLSRPTPGEAVDVTQGLIRDAGDEPESLAQRAGALRGRWKGFVTGVFVRLPPVFYRFAPPEEL